MAGKSETTAAEADAFLLWIGTTEDGLMCDGGNTEDAAERMCAAGLLVRGRPIDYIKVYHTTAAGVAAMGRTVQ